jgi:hypothetical protein
MLASRGGADAAISLRRARCAHPSLALRSARVSISAIARLDAPIAEARAALHRLGVRGTTVWGGPIPDEEAQVSA